MIRLGTARVFRTRSSERMRGVQLTVSLSTLSGNPDGERALSLSNYTGTRYVFRQKLSTDKVNAFTYRLKKLHPSENPAIVLWRILYNLPAVAGPVHRLKRDVECLDTAGGNVTSITSRGSKRSPAQRAGGLRRSTLRSMPRTLEPAA